MSGQGPFLAPVAGHSGPLQPLQLGFPVLAEFFVDQRSQRRLAGAGDLFSLV